MEQGRLNVQGRLSEGLWDCVREDVNEYGHVPRHSLVVNDKEIQGATNYPGYPAKSCPGFFIGGKTEN